MTKSETTRRVTEDPSAPRLLADAVRAAQGRAPNEQTLKHMATALGLAPPVPTLPPAAPASAVASAGKL
ncbi:MAG TPA: hypothetical protein VFY16_01190, partial [Gemmatimonadaceae bacterium]|nr:hypothetical protein [Gemmatimonadaceae bacterium]